MTKKHFIRIAAILQQNEADEFLIEDLMEYFEELNPNFNRYSFMEASMS